MPNTLENYRDIPTTGLCDLFLFANGLDQDHITLVNLNHANMGYAIKDHLSSLKKMER